MDPSARIGSFSVASSSYGAPVATVKPPDNAVAPQSPADVIATAQAATFDAIYVQLKAVVGTPTP